MGAKSNTPEGDRLDVLVTLVEAYERAHFPMDLPDAVDAIKFRERARRNEARHAPGKAFVRAIVAAVRAAGIEDAEILDATRARRFRFTASCSLSRPSRQ
jgi:antitoxin component HigA of HigAB toxin-antitoxin module